MVPDGQLAADSYRSAQQPEDVVVLVAHPRKGGIAFHLLEPATWITFGPVERRRVGRAAQERERFNVSEASVTLSKLRNRAKAEPSKLKLSRVSLLPTRPY